MNREQIREEENKLFVELSARNATTDQKLVDYDLRHRQKCQDMAAKIGAAKAALDAQPAPVQINEASLAYLHRIQSAKDANGNRLFDDVNSGLRQAHYKAFEHVRKGEQVPADVVAVLHSTGVK